MKFFKEIQEGESWTAAVIGYKFIQYTSAVDGGDPIKALKVSVHCHWLLIKIEFLLV